jgi:hypothetical protein
MRLQSESLTEEFWVCANTDCNKWVRRSSIIHHEKQTASLVAPLISGMASRFSIKAFSNLR